MSEIKRPLEGIKVVELATFIAAPCCARSTSRTAPRSTSAWTARR